MILFEEEGTLRGSQAGGREFGEPIAYPPSTSGFAVELDG